ncbi:MAG TPA: helix-turn-helix domain-containing protein [Anaeromyxobacter sp.]|nr:helix-turn-helix domain-containing protein [Anaeromyxobacter sp.]
MAREHADRRDWISTAQVAELLGVSAATVKRWAEAGSLPSERTRGGHRRFRRESVEQFRRAGAAHHLSPAATADSWIRLLLAPTPALAIELALLEARSQLGSWLAVAESLDPVLEFVGLRWAKGELTVLEEHLLAARLSRGLSWAAESLPVGSSAPSALLATPEGEDHTLGLSLVEVCLREAGWRTAWAGRRLPTSDLERHARAGGTSALLLSASVHSQAGILGTTAARLAGAAREGGVSLVMGGRGPWPDPVPPAERLWTLRELRAWADRLRAR